MPANPMFYRSITPLNREANRELTLAQGNGGFGFAKSTHMIPALLEEFAVAARTMPIVFTGNAAQPTPVFLVGLRPGENVFVDAAGAWSGAYVPAYVRRYPFILADVDGGNQIACFDQADVRLNAAGAERLFNEDGSDTPLLADKVRFMNMYMTGAKQTEEAMKLIGELDLLQPITIEAKLTAGSAILHGFSAVDEARLDALGDDTLLRLRTDKLLRGVYAHILSLGATEVLRERMERASA